MKEVMPLSVLVCLNAMSSPIDRLQQVLSDSLMVMGKENISFSTQGIEDMRRTVDCLLKDVGDRPAIPSKDRICSALNKLREKGAASLDLNEFICVCWGLTDSCGNHPKLIEDEPYFTDLMSVIRLRKPARFPWQGLLEAYFKFLPSRGEKGEINWLSLRSWLNSDLQDLYNSISPTLLPALTWLVVLREHQRLLRDNPCQHYAENALRGDRTDIDQIKNALHIPESSWFWPRLILSQVVEATGWRDDARFKGVLETLIAQLRDHPGVADDGLAKLLTRYAQCSDKAVHEGLKLFAVEQWGSPQFIRQVRWGCVEPNVKEMVDQWLVLEDLRDFFELLGADRAADQRRLDFWLRFIKQISFSHIVLGSTFWNSRDPDWKAFRDKKAGRISRLDGGGGNRNAFIMKIGGYYFVEFGDKGDACYGYADGKQPFKLGRNYLNYPTDMKDKSNCVFWGSHIDGRKSWERKFVVGSDSWPGLISLGIRPD